MSGRKKNQSGFTIHEMLIVVAISIVLLAVSIVGIATYMRHLQLVQLDNAAREIFLAAQNRAILLSGSQQLESLVSRPGGNRIDHVDVIPGSHETTQISVYYIHSKDAEMSRLLPAESIDPALWEGDFYITYAPESGSVVDVFFSDDELPVTGGFPAFYEMWRAAPKEERMDSAPMIGYYGGEAAESGTTISLRTPVINIRNENTLQVQVTYWIPRSLVMINEDDNVSLTVTMDYQGHTIPLTADGGWRETPGAVYFTYNYTWTLDELGSGRHFAELLAGLSPAPTCGSDFTIHAEVSYDGTLKVNGARKSATDNSLFAKDSGGDTAYLTCLRHLQNLDERISGVTGKTRAVQQRDITQVEGHVFQPIKNGALTAYDGADFTISGLEIQAAGEEPAGLFGVLTGTEAQAIALTRIRLADTAVSAGSGPAGTLVGRGAYLTLTDCRVYWEKRADQAADLQDVLGNSADGLRYQVTGQGYAGGLAGALEDSALTGCSASTLVESGGPAGGLAGQGSRLIIRESYGASYLKGGSAAGLVGELTGQADISASYAVGFIESTGAAATAAGLCLGSGVAQVEQTYSAMLFTAADTVTNYPLCRVGDYENVCYLDSEQFKFVSGNQRYARSYSELIDPRQWDGIFGGGVFVSKGTARSHPYNLQTTLSLTTFLYPGLERLDHWGDWGAQFQNGSLVYYEVYQDGKYGFSGGDVNHLREEGLVVQDGYAMAYKGTEPIAGIGAILEVTYQTAAGAQTETFAYGSGEENAIREVTGVIDSSGKEENFYLLPLPDKVVNCDYAAADFYQKITIVDVAERTEKRYYYNPHFANAILPYEEELDLSGLVRQLQVTVRSPRHLYMLSKYPQYYASGNQYRFRQRMDLDYGVYTGYGLFGANPVQLPIGHSAASPFRGGYYGGCNTITGVLPAVEDEAGGSYQYVGLFGYNTGVLQDVVYQVTGDSQLAVTQSGSGSAILYAGMLAGYNGGTVYNCAVSGGRLRADCYKYSSVYLGGLVGLNAGVIRSSAAEVAEIAVEASLSNAYAGGFVGRNSAGGSIDQCYAVGKVSAVRARYGNVYACGFAGRNEASVSRSYAAVSLSAEGEAKRYGFSPDGSTACVYLNKGNFTYRNANYAAQYADGSAAAVTWEELAGWTESSAVDALGMRFGAAATDDSGKVYPYPGAVTDGAGQSIHYGLWPDRMELGVVGVYYWEKLNIGTAVSYHLSAISLNEDGQISRSGTLSTAHGDGGVVTEYGYGYFHSADAALPELTSTGIGYSASEAFTPQSGRENDAANAALAVLMSEQYVFHSYNTWGTAGSGEGLYLVRSGQAVGGEPPYGTWTVKQGASVLTVRLNPFFADSMAQGAQALPGTEDNPYQVRSIDQLRFINWNNNAKNTTRRMDSANKHHFPYLCYGSLGSKTIRAFYWEQTHDLQGEEGGIYTPIAAVYDNTDKGQGDLFGWFGGTYDGNDYVIADVNIGAWSQKETDATSCVGLFGAVFDGTLKNIVLYSQDGTATVTGSNCGDSRWYAIGGLAGLAGSTTGSAVENCTVSGYRILDEHKSTTAGGWGGTGLGGLIGVADMSLKNCTAVTTIQLASVNNDHVRVGGLVGSCQGSINGCYSGGSITVTSDAVAKSMDNSGRPKGIYVGGVVGGIYMKPLRVGGSGDMVGQSGQALQNTLKNCYTYVELPAFNSNGYIKGLYAVGGSGELNRTQAEDPPGFPNADHGYTNYDNNYYLKAVVLKNNSNTSGIGRNDFALVTPLNYGQMADADTADGLLQKLNGNGGNFHTVTTSTSGGASLSGRYSFGNDLSLLGKDYPFPTILTQSSDLVKNGLANVHYGDWPLEGIRRPDGALPVNLDLFAHYDEAAGGAVQEERLSISDGIAVNGTWEVETADDTVAKAEVDQSGGLTITALGAGSTMITVTYTAGKEYTLNIEVNVTAQLRLAAAADGPILAFTGGAEASARLELRDQDNRALPDALVGALEIPVEKFTVEFDPNYLDSAAVSREEALTLTVVSDQPTEQTQPAVGQTQMTVGYDFTYLGQEYHATSVLALETATAAVELAPVEFVFAQGAVDEESRNYDGQEGFALKINDLPVDLADVEGLRITDYRENPEFNQIILVQWAEDEDGAQLPGTLSITAYPQSLQLAVATVQVEYQFSYGNSVHTLWQDLTVEVKKEESTEEVLP